MLHCVQANNNYYDRSELSFIHSIILLAGMQP